MKKITFLLIFISINFIFSQIIQSQENDELWSKTNVSAKSAVKKINIESNPSSFDLYDLNVP